MLSPAEILIANHPADGEHGHLKREVLLQDFYRISLRQWRRICGGQFEINRNLSHALLDRYARRYPNAPVLPCIVQRLPGGDLLCRVRQEDAAQFSRLLQTPFSPVADAPLADAA